MFSAGLSTNSKATLFDLSCSTRASRSVVDLASRSGDFTRTLPPPRRWASISLSCARPSLLLPEIFSENSRSTSPMVTRCRACFWSAALTRTYPTACPLCSPHV